ncbi:hypothetical protein U9M48_036902 [Paspalum notatum var. saurae]|uniref:Reverse transcriptase domain-containing protein n=1 Tax=Paspalum notatum var. saurae TaxID=547442 RepID=A0AAQ3UII9_PASNO
MDLLVQSFISGGSVAVNVNDEVGPYFQTKKGLRQGDLLSPILFNIVAEMLAILINRAKADGQISGVVPHLVEGGLSILQYADDTIIFMDNDLEHARNMKLLLCAFEQVSGLKINFHKRIFCFGAAQQNLTDYMQLFGCNSRDLIMKYLGIPVYYRRLSNTDWRKIKEWFEKRLSSWKSKHLSTGGRLTLINLVLSSLPMYMMSFFAIPKGGLESITLISRTQLCLANGFIICLHQMELGNKYYYSEKNGDSHFLACLMKVKHDFLRFGTFLIKNGSQEDRWLGQSTLREQYACLYNIARYKQTTVAAVLGTSLLNISWPDVVLRQDDDIFHWNLHPNGKFLVKSHYLALIHTDVPNINKRHWSLKAPLKIKSFFGIYGSKQCCFCHKYETIKHLFFECQFAHEVIFLTIHWLRSWAILQKPSSQDLVIAASQYLAQVAKEFFIRAHGWQSSLWIGCH